MGQVTFWPISGRACAFWCVVPSAGCAGSPLKITLELALHFSGGNYLKQDSLQMVEEQKE